MTVWALHQGVFSLDQRPLPLLGDGALLRVVVTVSEAAEDKLDQGRVQLVEVRGAFGWSDQ